MTDTFRIDGLQLIRAVTPARGRPYEHTCWYLTFTLVGHVIDEADGRPFTLEDLHGWTDEPWTAVAVAFAFLKERGCVVAARNRKSRAATKDCHLDSLTEWHALREKGS